MKTARTSDSEHDYHKFLSKVEKVFLNPQGQDATSRWNFMREAIHSSGMAAFGRMERPSHDWFNANLSIMEPLIEAKRQALLNYKKHPCERTLAALRVARSATQSAAGRSANDYWLKLCNEIQLAADLRNIRGLYDGIKRALGPLEKKTAPLKSKYSH